MKFPTLSAATYAYHLCMAHAFVDGNKRVAAVVSETFLLINGWQLGLENAALVDMFLKIADGTLSRDEIENMFRHHAVEIRD
ncbi:MAG: type II toxin-antitoxin system death-on-curing family toxin [Cyanobacteria bacterium J06627_28]